MSEWAQIVMAVIGMVIAVTTIVGGCVNTYTAFKMAELKTAADTAAALKLEQDRLLKEELARRAAEAARVAAEADRRAAEAAQHVREAAVIAQQVKKDLASSQAAAGAKQDETLDIVNKIHTLTNSNMGAALKLTAELSRWKAGQTKDSGDIEAAVLAEKNLKDHQDSQQIVDQGKKVDNK